MAQRRWAKGVHGAVALLPGGHVARAAERVRQALGRRERGHEAYALRLRAEVPARRDPPDAGAAEGDYRRAIAAAEALGMRPLEADCREGLGRLSHP